jgi:hypothetical protein
MLPTLGPISGVTSTAVITADLGADQLLVVSGIAIPDWNVNDNDNLYQDSVQVRLGVYALSIRTASVDVALCSIANDDSTFTFAVDSATVAAGPTGELTLTVDMALMGSHTALSRFSYQIVALVELATARISGTVTWLGSLWEPAGDPPGDLAAAAANLGITARQLIPPATQQSFPTWQPVGQSQVTSINRVPLGLDILVEADYEILGIPFGQELSVAVTPSPVFAQHAGGEAVVAIQTSGPSEFTLTPAAPSEECDFRITTTSPDIPQ